MSLIGLAMNAYRRSPLYPKAGKMLARALTLVPVKAAQVIKTVQGVTYELDLREMIDAYLYYAGVFEPEACTTIESLLKPGTNAIDIGANFGYHTFRLARGVGPTGRVLAIEPTQWAFDKLSRNVGLNSFANIQLVKAGLADKDLGPTDVAFRSSYRLDGKRLERTESVPLLTLDRIVAEQGLPSVSFIKMDVDGYEVKVLRGALETLRRHKPVLFFEVMPDACKAAGDDPKEAFDILRSLGYRFLSEERKPVENPERVCESYHGDTSVNFVAIAG